MPEVRPVVTAVELVEVLALREAVMVATWGLPPADARDAFDSDPMTLHCFVRDEFGVCVAAGRLTAPVDGERDGEGGGGNPGIGPIVVAPRARGRGLGRSVLEFLETEALALFGSNGTVRVEALVPEGAGNGAATIGYTLREGLPSGHPTWARQVFKDLAAS